MTVGWEDKVRQPIARFAVASVVAAAAVALPMAAAVRPAPASSIAQCPPGETGVIYGCAPFCLPGKYLSPVNGLCMPLPPPPPPPPRV
ncbi:Uncharacterised protein [Mycolicibacterium vanbaalenii]|uniref:Uncharacterized protein n=1 Tax=Mycolicibacterium vanbaalenii TaxID=110539 RepID=A0A5S9PIS6_MYCVN|nr:Uncharacterised protein [Mycolicibacterium vanbaalenii]